MLLWMEICKCYKWHQNDENLSMTWKLGQENGKNPHVTEKP